MPQEWAAPPHPGAGVASGGDVSSADLGLMGGNPDRALGSCQQEGPSPSRGGPLSNLVSRWGHSLLCSLLRSCTCIEFSHQKGTLTWWQLQGYLPLPALGLACCRPCWIGVFLRQVGWDSASRPCSPWPEQLLP